MAASTVVPLSKKSQEAFLAFYASTQDNRNSTREEMRARLEKVDRAYQREVDRTEENQRAEAANLNGDPNRFRNMTVPVVMPQVESAVTHQTSVFLTGQPLFGVVSDPAFMDEALQLESVMEDQSVRGGWARQLMLFFRNGFKHNFAPLEIDWASEVTAVVETDLASDLKAGVAKKVIWTGNRIRSLDPYNTFVDSRVPPTEVYKDGEFAGFTEFMSRIKLKKFIAELPDKIIANITPAFESNTSGMTGAMNAGAMNFYVPDINPKVSEQNNRGQGTNWDRWAGISSSLKKIDYQDGYEVTTIYVRVLPSEFDLRVPNSNTPQIYKLIIINHHHIIYAEQQTNAHGYLPILIGQPLEDGLSYQTKSLADNAEPFQALASSYMNSVIASRRRAISDRVLYDPSRITSAHINSANPSAKIPVRPAAYGKNISEAVYAFPYREDQAASSMQQISAILGLSNQLAGQNNVSQGQFQKGNKTLKEFEDTMENANGRDQLASILLEFQVFIPLKHILKINILQFQGGTTIYNRDKKVAVEIDPVQLRKAVLEFKVSDGLVPSSKLINGESWSVALQVIGSSPQIGQGYNMAPMFSYMMKTQGADLREFEKSQEQMAYEQAVGAWQQLAMQAIDKGLDLKSIPPQPLPEQFGYDPAANNPSPDQPNQAPANPTGEQ